MSEDEKDQAAVDKAVDEAVEEVRTKNNIESDLYERVKDIWKMNADMKINPCVLRREIKNNRSPDFDDMDAMEAPLYNLLGAAALFTDVAMGNGCEVCLNGLSFLAQAITNDVELLYRLYHGHPPKYNWG